MHGKKCEYGRCGGKGKRDVAPAAWRTARVRIVVDGRLMHVCESCADLLLRDRTKKTRRERAGQIQSAFDALPDYLKPEGDWTEEDL